MTSWRTGVLETLERNSNGTLYFDIHTTDHIYYELRRFQRQWYHYTCIKIISYDFQILHLRYFIGAICWNCFWDVKPGKLAITRWIIVVPISKQRRLGWEHHMYTLNLSEVALGLMVAMPRHFLHNINGHLCGESSPSDIGRFPSWGVNNAGVFVSCLFLSWSSCWINSLIWDAMMLM